MTYLVPANFKTDSLHEACTQLALDDVDDAPLAAAIARHSQRIDDWTADHFEAEVGATLVTYGEGTPRLYLTKRCRAVTSIKIRDTNGTLGPAITTSAYRLRSSLNAGGTARVNGSNLDWIDIVYGGSGIGYSAWGSSPWEWPCATNSIEVLGDFGWASTPGEIKRALALIVYDQFKQLRPSLRVAESIQTDTFVTRFVTPDPDAGIFTGIGEADDIIADMRHGPRVPVG